MQHRCNTTCQDADLIVRFLSIEHKCPAFVDEAIQIIAQVDSLNNNELICSLTVKANNLIAFGKTGQKILTREKIDEIFKKV